MDTKEALRTISIMLGSNSFVATLEQHKIVQQSLAILNSLVEGNKVGEGEDKQVNK